MSLSALNSPPLVAIAGIASIKGLLPHLENLVADGTIPWATLKLINVIAYGVNTVSVSLPGRIDGEEAEALVSEKKGQVVKRSEEAQAMTSAKGRSLVAPSGWAFAIWGPIFTGELIFSVAQLFLSESSPLTTLLKDISPAFIVAQTTQSLWCAAFRPKYKGKLMFLSSGLLASAAYSLSKAHAIYTAASSSSSYSLMEYSTFFLPLSLHFGWLTAATFVNFNGAVAMNKSISLTTVARVGHFSVVAATAAGVVVTVTRGAPVFGGVIAWALFAVADGMTKRMREVEKKRDGEVGGEGVKVQRGLVMVGAFVSLGSAVYVALLKR